jgi:type II secretory pathway pseudopilin PulG
VTSVIGDGLAEGVVLAICFAAALYWLVAVVRRKRREREQRRAAREREARQAKAQLQARAQATLRVDRGEQHAQSELDSGPDTLDDGQLEPAGALNAGGKGAEAGCARQKHPFFFEQTGRNHIQTHPYLAVVLMLVLGVAIGRRISRGRRQMAHIPRR